MFGNATSFERSRESVKNLDRHSFFQRCAGKGNKDSACTPIISLSPLCCVQGARTCINFALGRDRWIVLHGLFHWARVWYWGAVYAFLEFSFRIGFLLLDIALITLGAVQLTKLEGSDRDIENGAQQLQVFPAANAV